MALMSLAGAGSGGWGGGGREFLTKVLYREALPQGPTPHPFIYYFWQKSYSFYVPFIDKRYSFHIPSLEHYIPFNCCNCTVFNPSSPSINIQILQTDLHTFCWRIKWENLIIDQGIFSWVIILLILITYLLTMYGYCWEKIDLGHYWDLKG